MREKTSITLSSDVLEKIDRAAGNRGSRSAFIERVLREHFQDEMRRQIHARDLDRINAAADSLNREVLDVLEYQAPEEQ
ncbi:MAG TPA: ribbon-helix-helix protein, CopG family [Acidobacteriaceae bacterium]|jgi:metal-responsive CopG/Arc/MetJ family transcriptional regulator|nr:ribbon-helix-helix protein, CopG family [Acidobacteriaceae bacterium]